MRQFWKFLFLWFFLAAGFFSIASEAQLNEPLPVVVEKGRISGRILLKDGTPLSGGHVMLFSAEAGPPPSADGNRRTPDIIGPVGQDGNFSVELQPGKYYIAAIKRQSRERMGPPRKGDIVYRGRDGKGEPRIFVLAAGQHLDIGSLAEAAPFKGESTRQRPLTAIEGSVVDTLGNPVADAIVIAFLSSARRAKPVYSSEKTGKDGKYILGVGAGTYFLKVRKRPAGPPDSGDVVGFYGEAGPLPVSVKEGEIVKGINIKAVSFRGRGPFPGAAQ